MRLCCKHPLWYFFALKAHFRTFHRLWMKSKKCISLRETWQSVGGWSTGPEETRLSINDTAPQSLLCQDIIDKARKVCPKNVKTGGRHCPGYNKEAFTNRQASIPQGAAKEGKYALVRGRNMFAGYYGGSTPMSIEEDSNPLWTCIWSFQNHFQTCSESCTHLNYDRVACITP